MGWIDPRNLEHQRNRRLGPNAYRFAPGPSGVRMPDCLDRSAVSARAKAAEQELFFVPVSAMVGILKKVDVRDAEGDDAVLKRIQSDRNIEALGEGGDFARVTIPVSLSPATTGSRFTRLFSISATASPRVAS